MGSWQGCNSPSSYVSWDRIQPWCRTIRDRSWRHVLGWEIFWDILCYCLFGWIGRHTLSQTYSQLVLRGSLLLSCHQEKTEERTCVWRRSSTAVLYLCPFITRGSYLWKHIWNRAAYRQNKINFIMSWSEASFFVMLGYICSDGLNFIVCVLLV